jgi:hypothetical protein
MLAPRMSVKIGARFVLLVVVIRIQPLNFTQCGD